MGFHLCEDGGYGGFLVFWGVMVEGGVGVGEQTIEEDGIGYYVGDAVVGSHKLEM